MDNVACQRNQARRRRVLDEMENPDTERVTLMKAANNSMRTIRETP